MTLVLTNNPTLGNIVVVGTVGAVATGINIQDSNTNVYTLSPSSPYNPPTGGSSILAYILSAPSNATKTITFTWTGGGSADMWCDEFSLSNSGLACLDADATSQATFATNLVNLPSISPRTGNELFYALGAPNTTLTAPTSGSQQGGWIGATALGVPDGNIAEYALNVPTGLPVNFTDSTTGDLVATFVLALGSQSPIYMIAR